MITKVELKSVLRLSVADKLTAKDDSIIDTLIIEATGVFKSYIGNRYDTEALFAATGADRDPALLRYLKSYIAYELYSTTGRTVNDLIVNRYEEAIQWLDGINKGKISPAGWLLLTDTQLQPDPNCYFKSEPKYETNF